ncbi:sugar transferase [Tabrizicola sp. J26]|uniref:sugar transferase n=1 Tax=Alitabrizicola rongguiensis TaxID=2909234 RepID=UPI001F200B4F|nr:sugar transferase [Tabrizicola rongguiensis]MCF1708161.1 sugar transferase [Tabrizicola rongguiensis]
MTPAKRVMDVVVSVALLLVLAAPLVMLLCLVLLCDGRPILHVSERMKSPDTAFRLLKLRTMAQAPEAPVICGGDQVHRITPLGRFLRRTRLDEVPQLWNVLRGDMSLVGPRPPLRIYVERYPALYAQVLRSRPGVTGLASLGFHRHEERLLGACRTAQETDRVYVRRCIPRKARIDLIYQRRRTVLLDLLLLMATAWLPVCRLIRVK